MCCASQSYTGARLVKLLPAVWILSAGSFFLTDVCQADPSVTPLPPQPVEWVSGPAKVNLGGVAELKVPEGYRFADARGARELLEQKKSTPPKGLAGIAAPESGGWWVIFEFAENGYVSQPTPEQLDPAAILKAVSSAIDVQNNDRKARGLAPIAKVDWESKPAYKADSHTLEWGVRSEVGSEATITHSIRFFGRRGALEATAVLTPRAAKDITALKTLLKDFAFKEGQRYADFQKGDGLALGGPAESIAGNGLKTTLPSDSGQEIGRATLIGLIVVGSAGVVVLVFLLRKVRRKVLSAREAPSAHIAATASSITSGNGGKGIIAQPIRAASLLPDSRPKAPAVTLAPKRKALNNHTNGKQRRKVFNYHKFYTEMVLQVSPATRVDSYDGYSAETNGYNNHGPAHQNGRGRPELLVAEAPATNGHSEMIANQRTLIEEQKRLIEEQSRLIEEKSKLISEKNQLLKRQTELIDNNML